MHISVIFAEFKFDGFTEDTCRGMVATMDVSKDSRVSHK